MKHIRQINSVGTNSYTIVDLSGYEGVLEQHPILTEIPDTFEVSEDEIPEYYQLVSYKNE
jgi:hypothetical protein